MILKGKSAPLKGKNAHGMTCDVCHGHSHAAACPGATRQYSGHLAHVAYLAVQEQDRRTRHPRPRRPAARVPGMLHQFDLAAYRYVALTFVGRMTSWIEATQRTYRQRREAEKLREHMIGAGLIRPKGVTTT